MIWLAWRQHRNEVVVFAAIVTATALVNLGQGLRAAALSTALALLECRAFIGPGECLAVTSFEREFGWMHFFPLLFASGPVLVAPFLAAPLVAREYEFRTTLLAWAQGVTRARWLVVKTALLSAAVLVGALALAAVAPIAEHAWSYGSIAWQSSFEWSAPVLLGTAFFAVALGVFCGALTRRVLAAMLLALILVAVARGAVGTQLRPSYLPPLVAASDREVPADAWRLANYWVDADGRVVPPPRVSALQNEYFRSWPRPTQTPDEYLRERGIFYQIPYQPRERQIPFQVIELAIYSALALSLFGASVWLVRRRAA
jgi:hypothetical protein